MASPLGALEPLTEAKFLKMVLDLAKLRGWRTAHFRPAKTSKGWRTAVQGDGRGFPDLILIRDRVMVVAELKVGRGQLTEEQKVWLAAFARLEPVVRVLVWRPADWEKIQALLW